MKKSFVNLNLCRYSILNTGQAVMVISPNIKKEKKSLLQPQKPIDASEGGDTQTFVEP